MSEPAAPRKAMRWTLWLPAVVFAGFVALVGYNLRNPAEREVRSALIGKPLPEFALQAAVEGQPGLTRADLANGQPHLLNIFASWCVPCVQEIPMLIRLKAAGAVILGKTNIPAFQRDFRRRHRLAAGSTGKSMQIVVPTPSWLVTRMSPSAETAAAPSAAWTGL